MGQQLIGKPVMSLRTGGSIGIATELIVNPNNLKVEGWYVDSSAHKEKRILLSLDVRDIIEQGFVVNDHDALTDPSELVRLEKVLRLRFELTGKSVVTEDKKRLGKVTDYAFEKSAFFIQKLYIGQSIVKSFSGGSAIVDRSQIIEINNRKIIVKEATVPGKVEAVSQAARPAMSPAQT